MKPIAEACLRNQGPITEILSVIFTQPADVLEIGSGTGQHAVYIANKLKHLRWQPTDLAEHLAGIEAWVDEAGLENVCRPFALDVCDHPWPVTQAYDAVFTANTMHFVDWHTVEALLEGTAKTLRPKGTFCIYGPFNENGQFTSEGNERLDRWLKYRDPDSGLKDKEEVIERCARLELKLADTYAMPANNMLLKLAKI